MDNPTCKSGYTKEDLREYAHYRKQKDLKGIDKVLRSKKEKHEHENHREPLCFREKKLVDIQLSWGGDADGYKLYFGYESGELYGGVYYWADWGVYEEEDLTHEEAEKVANYYDRGCY